MDTYAPEDLLNAAEVAELLGLSSRTAIATYRSRHEDFPVPVIQKGTCVLWARPDVKAWRERHPTRGKD